MVKAMHTMLVDTGVDDDNIRIEEFAVLPADVDRLDRFVRGAIAGREDGKFVFTRSLSDALEALADFGTTLGFDRDDLAHVRIEDLLRCREGLADPRAFLLRRVEEGVEEHLVTQGVALPAQIASEIDLMCFEQVTAEPNFVTRHTVEAAAVVSPSGPAWTSAAGSC